MTHTLKHLRLHVLILALCTVFAMMFIMSTGIVTPAEADHEPDQCLLNADGGTDGWRIYPMGYCAATGSICLDCSWGCYETPCAPLPHAEPTCAELGYNSGTYPYCANVCTNGSVGPYPECAVPSGLSASCNVAGTQATLSWNSTYGATGYYVRVYKGGQSCPSGWMQAGWNANYCTPNPDWVTGTSIAFPTQSGSTYQWGMHAANGSGYSSYVTGPNFSCTVVAPQCSDGINNDADAFTDYPNDPGCTGPTDTTESPNPPTVDLTATPTSVVSGASATLTWTSSGATSCTGTGFSTGGATNNTTGISTGALSANANYQISCNGASDTASVTVTNPTADITATPDRVNAGGTANITWTTSQCTVATLTRNGAAFSSALSGTNVPATNITSQTTFRLTCDGGTVTDTVIVNLVPTFEEF